MSIVDIGTVITAVPPYLLPNWKPLYMQYCSRVPSDMLHDPASTTSGLALQGSHNVLFSIVAMYNYYVKMIRYSFVFVNLNY